MGNFKGAVVITAITLASIALASVWLGPRHEPFVAGAASLTPSVATFDRVRLDGAFATTITVGKSARIRVSGDPALVRNVTTDVENGTLTVGERDRGANAHDVVLEISVPALRSFANDGAGGTTIRGVSGDIEFDNSGAGSIVASGRANSETVSLDGVGKIDTQGVDARDVSVDSNGVGAVYVRGSGTLSLTVNGIGEIRYAGHPAHVEQQVNGLGQIGPI
jgi:hypothetical protein